MVFMVQASDHISGITGLSAGLTIYLSKNGGAAAAITPTVAEIDATNMPGWYSLALTTAHTDTLGDFALHITGASADPTDLVRQVVLDLPGIAQTGDSYARLGAPVGASISADIAGVQSDTDNIQTRLPAALVSGRMDSDVGALQANVITATSINADAITAAKIADGAIDAGTFAANAITATAIAADAITDAKVASDVTIASVTGAVGSVTGNVGGNVTGSVGSIATGGIAAASFAAGAINAAAIAADAITDAKVAADVTIASVTGAVGSVTGAVGSVTGNVGGNVTGSVGSVATGGISAASFAAGAIDAAAIAADAIDASALAADAVTEIQSGLATAANLATLTGYVDTEVAAIKVVTDKLDTTLELEAGSPTQYRFTADALALSPSGVSAAAIADAVWEEAIGDHSGTVGSTAEQLAAAGAAGDPWATPIPGAYGAGTAGKIVGDNLNATVSSRATQTSVDTIDDLLDTEVAAIKAKTDQLTFGTANRVDAQVFGMEAGTVTAAAIATGAVDADALAADASAEIADAVWDEAIAAHQNAGSTGEALTDAGAAGNPWNTTIEGSYTAEDLFRVMAAVLAGKTDITNTGGGTATVVFRDVSDTSDIVTAAVTGSERTTITLAP